MSTIRKFAFGTIVVLAVEVSSISNVYGSCGVCPPGHVCYVPMGDWNQGYCIPEAIPCPEGFFGPEPDSVSREDLMCVLRRISINVAEVNRKLDTVMQHLGLSSYGITLLGGFPDRFP